MLRAVIIFFALCFPTSAYEPERPLALDPRGNYLPREYQRDHEWRVAYNRQFREGLQAQKLATAYIGLGTTLGILGGLAIGIVLGRLLSPIQSRSNTDGFCENAEA
jgi:hypothetical protein